MSRDFTSSQRTTIWKNYFGANANSGKDAYGRNVSKGNFEADHIWPHSQGGKTVVQNGMPLHPTSNAEKAEQMKGSVNGKRFYIQGTKDAGITNVNGTAYGYRGKR